MTGGPSPVLSKAIFVPSLETVSLTPQPPIDERNLGSSSSGHP
jgi:hypothetical protein